MREALDIASVIVWARTEANRHARAVRLGEILTGRAAGRTRDAQIAISDHCGIDVPDKAMVQLVSGRSGEG